MALWCRDFKTVSVPQGSDPKTVTYVYPYYENPQFLRTQLGWWSTYPEHLKQHISVNLVDDGSPKCPAVDVLDQFDFHLHTSLFRIEVDVRWNWLAARNIGAHHATSEWLLMTDMDHVVPATTAAALVYGKHDPSVVYAFTRIEYTGMKANPHSASFFMTKEMYWRIGGYDEALSGHYGTDGDYRRRLAHHAPIEIRADRLVRHEYQGDSSTTTYLRKQPEDAGVKALVAKRGKKWKPKVLSFPYHQVAL